MLNFIQQKKKSAEFKFDRFKLVRSMSGNWVALRHELTRSMGYPTSPIRVPGFPRDFAIRPNFWDLDVFRLVFIKRELDDHLPLNPSLIIDGGANIGLTTAFYAQRFPRCKVIAVEPSESNIEILKMNCAAFPNIEVLKGGLWSSSGTLNIVNPGDTSIRFKCGPADPGDKDSFQAFTVQEIIKSSGFERCDLLKLDIEGAEMNLFEVSRNWISSVDAVLVEIHGPQAQAAVAKACPQVEYEVIDCGEKKLIRQRQS